eukprot:CAMPEP_0172754490 /NCGR_PEP_ID=MMETSP1074-20121228/157985_1 /TAXON_ID=2916 /ORGANISM="Ceratium fusus, Strain PA161109" /LENGTH=96 /DNA_ID=CAMNT_0013587393 /DNA_START=246 /DNA_END=536 /DNA_ORIENTATION=-
MVPAGVARSGAVLFMTERASSTVLAVPLLLKVPAWEFRFLRSLAVRVSAAAAPGALTFRKLETWLLFLTRRVRNAACCVHASRILASEGTTSCIAD